MKKVSDAYVITMYCVHYSYFKIDIGLSNCFPVYSVIEQTYVPVFLGLVIDKIDIMYSKPQFNILFAILLNYLLRMCKVILQHVILKKMINTK